MSDIMWYFSCIKVFPEMSEAQTPRWTPQPGAPEQRTEAHLTSTCERQWGFYPPRRDKSCKTNNRAQDFHLQPLNGGFLGERAVRTRVTWRESGVGSTEGYVKRVSWDTWTQSSLNITTERHKPFPAAKAWGKASTLSLRIQLSPPCSHHPISGPLLRRQQQRSSLLVWWHQGLALVMPLPLLSWEPDLCFFPHGRTVRNSQLPEDLTGLHMRDSPAQVREIFQDKLRNMAMGQGNTPTIFPEIWMAPSPHGGPRGLILLILQKALSKSLFSKAEANRGRYWSASGDLLSHPQAPCC